MSEHIKGWDKLMSKLSQLSGPQIEEAAKQSALMLALATTAAAKLLAPVDSGEMRSGIHSDVVLHDGYAIGYSFTDVNHAAYVEFGTGPVGAESGGNGSNVDVHYSLGPFSVKRGNFVSGQVVETLEDYWVYCDENGNFWATRGQPAKPFMYPAAQEVKQQALKVMATAIKGYIAKAAAGG